MIWVCEEEDAYVGRTVLEIELSGKGKVGGPKRRSMDAVKDGMTEVGVDEGDVHDRRYWKRKICCGDP